jgi:hypothetical protein
VLELRDGGQFVIVAFPDLRWPQRA